MTMFGSQWLANAGASYEIDQSIRFNDDDSAHMARDGFGQSPTSSTDCTISVWVKRGNNLGSNSTIFYGGDPNGSTAESLRFGTGDQLQFSQASVDYDLKTTQVFRDPSAWYHIVAVLNTDAAESSRAALYVNGSQVTDFATENYPGSSYSTNFTANSSSVEHVIGSNAAASNASQFFDGYIAEFNFIDGQVLTPASFGETNNDGVWIPKKYSGAYGNNGFFIDGRDSSDLGDDESGNGNDLAGSGLAAADSVLDSPTNNMPTLNPLSSGTGTLSDGNLQYVGVSSWTNSRLNLLVPDTGKWALRFKSTTSYQQIMVGLCAPDSATTYGDLDQNGVAMIRYNTIDGNFVTRVGGSRIADTGPPTVAAQTFFQLLFDMDNGKMGVAADDATSGTFADISTYPALDLNAAALQTARQPYVLVYSGTDSGAGAILDAGQSGWTTTVTGFKNLILANLDAPTITDGSAYFQATTYTGDGGSSHEINQTGNSSFEPSLVWIKSRSAATSNVLQDQVRGNFVNFSDLTNAQGATGGGWVNSFDSNGFTVNVNTPINDSGKTFVGWQWKANGSGSSNEDGSINTTATSVDTTSGFSISTYTGTGANATVGHGLGTAPSFVIIKSLNDTHDWYVRTPALSGTEFILLNSNAAKGTSSPEVWNSTAPTSTIVNIGTSIGVNRNTYNYVMYCFAEIPGYSQISSYTGNNDADGPFVYTGFAPHYVLWKNADTAGNHWVVADRARSPKNVSVERLFPDLANAESTSTAMCDFLSNGFKIRSTMGEINTSGDTIIYMALAENPFGGEDIAPVTAR
jgi:hypothetical protein